MQKNLLAKFCPHGYCKNGMDPVTTNVTPKTRDDLIYTIEEGEYELYKVVEIQEDGNVVNSISPPKSFLRHPDLDFHCTQYIGGKVKNGMILTLAFIVKLH